MDAVKPLALWHWKDRIFLSSSSDLDKIHPCMEGEYEVNVLHKFQLNDGAAYPGAHQPASGGKEGYQE